MYVKVLESAINRVAWSQRHHPFYRSERQQCCCPQRKAIAHAGPLLLLWCATSRATYFLIVRRCLPPILGKCRLLDRIAVDDPLVLLKERPIASRLVWALVGPWPGTFLLLFLRCQPTLACATRLSKKRLLLCSKECCLVMVLSLLLHLVTDELDNELPVGTWWQRE